MRSIDDCLKMQQRAQGRIPGMTQLLSKRPDMFSLGAWPGYYSKAKGAQVWDLDGNQYTDMSISGIGANILGYADDDVDNAVVKAIGKGVSCSLNCPEEVELAELLCELHPWADMVRYARTGGEAMTVAVRIARAATGKDKIAFCGYHGWHDWYLAANLGTENALGDHLLPGLSPQGVPAGLEGTTFPFRYNHLEELEEIVARHGDELSAIVMEPIRSQEPADGFVSGVKSLARKAGAVLIVDEISAGLRLNTGGAHLLYGFEPDMAVFSKALGNGYAMASIIGVEDVMQAAQSSFISSTCWTERVGPVAAMATLSKHRTCNVAEHLVRIGRSVKKGWKDLAAKHGLDIAVGGIDPLGHFGFNDGDGASMKALFIQMMLERGFLASNLFYATFAHSDSDVSAYLRAVDEVFPVLVEARDNGLLVEKMYGRPASSGFHRLT